LVAGGRGERRARLLAAHTETLEECFFAIWEGFGDLPDGWPRRPKLPMPNGGMFLFRGPLAAATTSFSWHDYRIPSLWWTADRAWCVGTDVDLRSSYVGATAACINDVLADPSLETFRVASDLWLSADADEVNPAPAGEYPYG
jgi:hypothetical protein